MPGPDPQVKGELRRQENPELTDLLQRGETATMPVASPPWLQHEGPIPPELLFQHDRAGGPTGIPQIGEEIPGFPKRVPLSSGPQESKDPKMGHLDVGTVRTLEKA